MTQLTDCIVAAFPNGAWGKAGELIDEARRLDAENAVLRERLEAAEELIEALWARADVHFVEYLAGLDAAKSGTRRAQQKYDDACTKIMQAMERVAAAYGQLRSMK